MGLVEKRIACCIRPDVNGVWYIQNDGDHAPIGIDTSVGLNGLVQTPTGLIVYFSPVGTKCCSVQVSTDDDWAGSILASAGLGNQNTGISVRAFPHIKGNDAPIDPAKIWEYLPSHLGYIQGSGNLWLNATILVEE